MSKKIEQMLNEIHGRKPSVREYVQHLESKFPGYFDEHEHAESNTQEAIDDFPTWEKLKQKKDDNDKGQRVKSIRMKYRGKSIQHKNNDKPTKNHRRPQLNPEDPRSEKWFDFGPDVVRNFEEVGESIDELTRLNEGETDEYGAWNKRRPLPEGVNYQIGDAGDSGKFKIKIGNKKRNKEPKIDSKIRTNYQVDSKAGTNQEIDQKSMKKKTLSINSGNSMEAMRGYNPKEVKQEYKAVKPKQTPRLYGLLGNKNPLNPKLPVESPILSALYNRNKQKLNPQIKIEKKSLSPLDDYLEKMLDGAASLSAKDKPTRMIKPTKFTPPSFKEVKGLEQEPVTADPSQTNDVPVSNNAEAPLNKSIKKNFETTGSSIQDRKRYTEEQLRRLNTDKIRKQNEPITISKALKSKANTSQRHRERTAVGNVMKDALSEGNREIYEVARQELPKLKPKRVFKAEGPVNGRLYILDSTDENPTNDKDQPNSLPAGTPAGRVIDESVDTKNNRKDAKDILEQVEVNNRYLEEDKRVPTQNNIKNISPIMRKALKSLLHDMKKLKNNL